MIAKITRCGSRFIVFICLTMSMPAFAGIKWTKKTKKHSTPESAIQHQPEPVLYDPMPAFFYDDDLLKEGENYEFKNDKTVYALLIPRESIKIYRNRHNAIPNTPLVLRTGEDESLPREKVMTTADVYLVSSITLTHQRARGCGRQYWDDAELHIMAKEGRLLKSIYLSADQIHNFGELRRALWPYFELVLENVSDASPEEEGDFVFRH